MFVGSATIIGSGLLVRPSRAVPLVTKVSTTGVELFESRFKVLREFDRGNVRMTIRLQWHRMSTIGKVHAHWYRLVTAAWRTAGG